MTSRLIVLIAPMLLLGAGTLLRATPAAAATRDEDALAAGCDWLERAIAREPDREDSFGMFMRGMRPKCQAMLEGIARKDNSVRPDAVQSIVKEIKDLQEVIDGEHGGPPPAGNGPSPADVARQKIADEKAAQDKVTQDKAAEDKAAKDKAAEEKAAEDKAAADKAAQDKAAEEARKAAERDAKRQEQVERKTTEEERKAAEREERERVAAEKKAAEEAKKAAAREERERAAADKKAAEEAKKAAAREERERVAAEKAQAEADKRAAAEREAAAREEARRKAAALVAEEEVAEQAEKKEAEERAKKAAEERERKAAEEREKKALDEARRGKTPSKKGAIDGTWEQPEAKVLDRHVKRTLNLLSKDKKVQGELYEEVWFAAPAAWIDASCGGNTTYRMVTTARVSGEVEGNSLVLTREVPRILTCTCSSRCTVETRRRGFDLEIGASGSELKDKTGVFVRPGTAIVTQGDPVEGPQKVLSPRDFAGNWETSPFKQRDRSIVQRVELTVDGDGRVSGTFIERSTQGLPLASWKDRFCDGSEKWDWVTQWKVEGKVSGRKLTLKATDGTNLLCTCPSKCTAPKERMTVDLVYGATGATLTFDGETFERK